MSGTGKESERKKRWCADAFILTRISITITYRKHAKAKHTKQIDRPANPFFFFLEIANHLCEFYSVSKNRDVLMQHKRCARVRRVFIPLITIKPPASEVFKTRRGGFDQQARTRDDQHI